MTPDSNFNLTTISFSINLLLTYNSSKDADQTILAVIISVLTDLKPSE